MVFSVHLVGSLGVALRLWRCVLVLLLTLGAKAFPQTHSEGNKNLEGDKNQERDKNQGEKIQEQTKIKKGDKNQEWDENQERDTKN